MPVHALVGTLIFLSFQSRVGVKQTKSTPYLLPLGKLNLQGIVSLRVYKKAKYENFEFNYKIKAN
ncbi:hypothetical protein MXB_1451 [Myxobolus squamalis]|nr:hypothetical protein MXB_1451 [Myxobolus squamalis]